MKFTIKETNQVQELDAIIDGINCVQDLIGNSGAIGDYITYIEEDETYHISKENFDWWREYLENTVADHDELAGLKDEYDVDEVNKIIGEEFSCHIDYEDEHRTYQYAFSRVRDELRAQ